MTERAGNVREAIARWRDVLNDPRNDDGRARHREPPDTHAVGARGHPRPRTRRSRAIAQRFGRPPARLEDLVSSGFLKYLPQDPDGNPYAYDPAAGTVSSSVRILKS